MPKLSKDQLTLFIESYQGIIAAIALFATLSTFFVTFLDEEKFDPLVVIHVKLISQLFVLFLLIFLFTRIEQISKKEKLHLPLNIFRFLLLLFLALFILLTAEIIPNMITSTINLIILGAFLSLALKCSRNNYFSRKFLSNFPLTLPIYIIILFALVRLMINESCKSIPYLQFIAFSLSLSMLLYAYLVLIFTTKEEYESFKRNRHQQKIWLIIIIVIIILGFAVVLLVQQMLIIESLSNFILWLIFLPENYLCAP